MKNGHKSPLLLVSSFYGHSEQSFFSLQYHPNIVTGSTVSEEGSIERGGIQGKSLICPAEGLEIQRLLFRTVQWSPIFSFIKYKTRGFNTFLT